MSRRAAIDPFIRITDGDSANEQAIQPPVAKYFSGGGTSTVGTATASVCG